VAVGDFNGDGMQDLAVANDTVGIGSVSVLLGNGDGTFQPAQNFAAGSSPFSVAVGDFNGDGVPDLAVANLNSINVSVLLGNGDGTFQPAQNFGVGTGPRSMAVGDFNGDGKLDLAVAALFTSVSVLINNTPSQSPAALSPRHP
jgi:VCBS repeat protein/FG-GAP repeat protein